jgi:glycosyltransferase involved in cell wall biosynthesis
MSSHIPRVSIGMPVFNGELYLKEAVDSILAQTYPDFELIISDNASTDATEKICEAYVAKDRRVTYHRNKINLGGCRNQNRLVELSLGEYFMWAHHDDRRVPEYIEHCVRVLDENPSVSLCYSKTRVIDENGKFLEDAQTLLDIASSLPQDRFRSLIRLDYKCGDLILGMFRASVLKRTSLLGLYADHDRVLLSELALYGPFYEIPEYLFFRRRHTLQSTAVYRGRRARTVWCDPTKAGKIVFPYFREFVEFLFAINRVPLPWNNRAYCYLEMMKWFKQNWKHLKADVITALGEMLLSPIRQLKKMVMVAVHIFK